MTVEGPVFPAAFDALAMAEDIARLGEGGAEALAALGREIDQAGGLPRAGFWLAMRKAARAPGWAAASRPTSRGRRAVSGR